MTKDASGIGPHGPVSERFMRHYYGAAKGSVTRPDVSVICSDCAKAKGATWREGHCATWWNGTCEVCNQPKGVCAVTDWSWPK